MTRENSRPIEVVGVMGLGTMGAGIAEVMARNGLQVVAVEADEPRGVAGRGHVEHSTSRAVARGKLSAGRPAGPDRADPVHVRPGGPRGRPARRGGGAREAGPQAGDLRQARLDLLRRHGARDEHLEPVRHRDLGRDPRPAPRRRHALLQPRAGAEVRRDRPHGRDRAGRRGRRGRPCPAPGQAARRRRRQGRVHRERAAVRLPQPRRADVRAARRDARGPRRRHDARLRPADGPAGADGPHRSRHRVRDPRHDVQAGPGPAARARAAAQAAGRGGLLGRKTGRGFYTYAEAGLLEHRRGPVRGGAAGSCPGRRGARGPQRRRGGLRDDGDGHRRGLREGRVRRRCSWPAAPRRWRPRGSGSCGAWGRRCGAAS